MKIKDSVVLVTGANRGIGQAFVQAFLARGAAKVYAAARQPDSVASLVSAGGKRVEAVALDITKPDQVNAAAAKCKDVTILVNNAGINLGAGFMAAPSMDVARREMETNYFGTLAMSRSFAPVLAKNGGGAIVNLLTVASLANFPLMGSYSASKAAMFSLTQSLRQELKKQGTQVIGAFPGAVDTDLTKDYHGPKDDPDTVVGLILDGVEAGAANVWPGPWSQQVAGQLGNGLWEFEGQLAAFTEQLMQG